MTSGTCGEQNWTLSVYCYILLLQVYDFCGQSLQKCVAMQLICRFTYTQWK